MTKVKLKEIVDIFNGSTPDTSNLDYYSGDIPWLTPKDLSDQKKKYIIRGERNLSVSGLKSIGNKLLPKGAILFSSRAPIGLISITKSEVSTNQGFKNFVCKENKIYNQYLYYLLKIKTPHIQELGTGTTFKEVSKTTLEDFELYIEENYNSQKKIAAVLSALDDKIELDNQINMELEAMAKTIYNYWFVQFDFPDENGNPYKSSGGKMVFNETLKREIPEGWEVKSLYQIANFINGLACQKFRPENEDDEFLPVIKIREMNDGISGNTEKVRLNIPEKNIINDGDVLFSWSATLDVKIWTEGKAGLNQHIFKVISDKFPRSFYYFETLNYLQHFKMMAELRKTTMGHITIDHLKASYIPIPPIDMVKTLDDKLKPILEKVISNKKQNQELAKLRDWLLPMLMNGQVTVGSGEYDVEERSLGMVADEPLHYNNLEEKTSEWYDQRFELWVSQQGLAARGNIDKATLRELFDAMNDEDK